MGAFGSREPGAGSGSAISPSDNRLVMPLIPEVPLVMARTFRTASELETAPLSVATPPSTETFTLEVRVTGSASRRA